MTDTIHLARPARLALGALLVVHGLIHLIGVVVPWGIATVEGFPYRTTILGDAVAIGETGARLLGLGWFAVCVGFVVAGIGVLRGTRWWLPLAVTLSLVSGVLCVLGLPEAATGIPVNLVVLVACAWLALRRPRPSLA